MKKRLIVFLALLSTILIFFVGAGCGGDSVDPPEEQGVAVSISVNPIRIELITGQQWEIEPTVTVNKEGVTKSVRWTTANSLVASVDNIGVVTARGKGTVIITATTIAPPYLTASSEIYVTDPEGDLDEYRGLILIELAADFAGFKEDDFSETNYQRIEGYYNNGVENIQKSLSKNSIDNEYDEALKLMKSVQTLKAEAINGFRLENGSVLALNTLTVSIGDENAVKRAENHYSLLGEDIRAELENEIRLIRSLIDRIEQLKTEKQINDVRLANSAALELLTLTDKNYSEAQIELMRTAYGNIMVQESFIIKALENELVLFSQYIATYEENLLQSEILAFRQKHSDAFMLDADDALPVFKSIIEAAIADFPNLSINARTALSSSLSLFETLLEKIVQKEEADLQLVSDFKAANPSFISVIAAPLTAGNYSGYITATVKACYYVNYFSEDNLALLEAQDINPFIWFERIAETAGLTAQNAAEMKTLRASNYTILITDINSISINFNDLYGSLLLDYVKTYVEFNLYIGNNTVRAELLAYEKNIVENINNKITALYAAQNPNFKTRDDFDAFVKMTALERSAVKRETEELLTSLNNINNYLNAYSANYTFGKEVVTNRQKVLYTLKLIDKIENATYNDILENGGEDLFFETTYQIYYSNVESALTLTLSDIVLTAKLDGEGNPVKDGEGNDIMTVANYEVIKAAYETLWIFDTVPETFTITVDNITVSVKDAANFYYNEEKTAIHQKLSALMEEADRLNDTLPEIETEPETETEENG